MMLSPSSLFLAIDWQGLAGRHIIRLQITLDDESDESERAEAIADAAGLFRNFVGLEVIDDAVNAGEWPMGKNTGDIADEPIDPWRRMKE